MYHNILETIGNTPLVQIKLPTPARVYGKMEYTNPGGSIKDRPALYMVTQAELQGKIKPNDTLVLPSSGNMGIALAMIGNLKTIEWLLLLQRKHQFKNKYFKSIRCRSCFLCPSTTDQNDPKGYVQTAVRLAKEKNAFLIDQFNDTLNQEAHYHGLGPEIWRDTDGCITHFVAAAGTGALCRVLDVI
ncbi:MAG: pyridoxal-phosphate dependent enzyme [Holosporaceae bacterium]|nr:MAG: pyridoxal-phosphate dependent enzyme [Holosporaceae bacterium]